MEWYVRTTEMSQGALGVYQKTRASILGASVSSRICLFWVQRQLIITCLIHSLLPEPERAGKEVCHTHVSVSRHIGRDADGCLSLLTVHSPYNREYYVTVPLYYTTWVQGFEIRRIKSLFSFHKHVPPFIFPVPCCHRLKLSPDCHRVNLKRNTLRLEMWGTGS